MVYYEIHITCANYHKDLFLDLCERYNIKNTEIAFPLVLKKDNHLMTSIRVKYDNEVTKELNDYIKQIEYIFKDIDILRVKVEASKADTFKYIETHISFPLNFYSEFEKINTDWVVSYNVNRPDMFSATKRIYDTDNIVNILSEFECYKHLCYEKHIELEYCIYDSNILLDTGWL